jgi:hypothetical protein
MTYQIPLSKGQFALVDDTDYARLAPYQWFHSGTGYAVAFIRVDGRFRLTYLHRFLLEVGDGLQVDHVNCDKFDNRRANLRLASAGQNAHNRKPSSLSRTGLKGVGWHKRKLRYQARIQFQGMRYTLGSFDDPDLAALAYDAAARLLFGDYARLNYPDQSTPLWVAMQVRQRLKKRGVKVD